MSNFHPPCHEFRLNPTAFHAHHHHRPPAAQTAPRNLRTALPAALHRPTANRRANKADTRLRPVHRPDNSSTSSNSMARRHQVQVVLVPLVEA
jgi:hypothetical protein